MSKQAVEDFKKTQKLRNEFDLYLIKKGYRHCLRCDKEFLSQDVKAQRMCNECRVKNY